MDDHRLLRMYSRSSSFWSSLVYNFLISDRYFRSLFHIGDYCGVITTITCLLIVLVLTYTATNWTAFLSNTKKFNDLCCTSDQILPRQESVVQVRPAYNCINKHIQQVDTFLDKTKKVLQKEKLEIEIMNSRINSITELLLNPVPQWSRARTAGGGYYRRSREA